MQKVGAHATCIIQVKKQRQWKIELGTHKLSGRPPPNPIWEEKYRI